MDTYQNKCLSELPSSRELCTNSSGSAQNDIAVLKEMSEQQRYTDQ